MNRYRFSNFRRALLLAPSDECVAALPGGRIPDRRDLAAMGEAERLHARERVGSASAILGDELRELIACSQRVRHVRPWSHGESR